MKANLCLWYGGALVIHFENVDYEQGYFEEHLDLTSPSNDDPMVIGYEPTIKWEGRSQIHGSQANVVPGTRGLLWRLDKTDQIVDMIPVIVESIEYDGKGPWDGPRGGGTMKMQSDGICVVRKED